MSSEVNNFQYRLAFDALFFSFSLFYNISRENLRDETRCDRNTLVYNVLRKHPEGRKRRSLKCNESHLINQKSP